MLDNNWIIGGGKKREERKPMDFYPTPAVVTEILIEFLRKVGMLPDGCTVWECACGDGAMCEVLEDYGYSVIGTDIRTDCYGIGGIDFINTNARNVCDWIITNPPFNVSEKFIRKCLTLNIPFALLLKSQYWHSMKRYDLFYERKPAYVLPLTFRPDFTGGGASLMDMHWNIWDVKDRDTIYLPMKKPRG